MPGRLVGESIDAHGNPAYRLALQTREQHIRREKATSNICTAQALLAIMATLYAAYHGPQGLKEIGARVHKLTSMLANTLNKNGIEVLNQTFFDTLHIKAQAKSIQAQAVATGYNINIRGDDYISISLDETSNEDDIKNILSFFNIESEVETSTNILASRHARSDSFLTQQMFNSYHSETEMMRYLRKLADKDLALDRTMIPLGSCTMKLNAASEMIPVTWPEFANMHPFAPQEQTATGYDKMSLQPNAGSQGEYAGLLAIKGYHEARNDFDRDICLIPSSAHGTNPASAQMANMQVVVTKCDDNGNVDLADLKEKIAEHPNRIAAIMITYPSTHGVYIDGANLNALVGVAQPGKFGGDVSHLNLHKTFCIPHGGGGPGVGPIGVGKHLEPFMPKDGINAERHHLVVQLYCLFLGCISV